MKLIIRFDAKFAPTSSGTEVLAADQWEIDAIAGDLRAAGLAEAEIDRMMAVTRKSGPSTMTSTDLRVQVDAHEKRFGRSAERWVTVFVEKEPATEVVFDVADETEARGTLKKHAGGEFMSVSTRMPTASDLCGQSRDAARALWRGTKGWHAALVAA